ncbi:MAG: GDP-mannose 4,6-dehydratase [Candidatus Nealsonbacteria bacterium]
MQTSNGVKILITGITGFVGSYLAEYCLAKKGAKVYGTMLAGEKFQGTKQIKDKIGFFQCNLTDQGAVIRLLKKLRPDKIFHLAALSAVAVSWKSPEQILYNNILAELNLFDAIRKLKLNPVIHIAGSSEQYGLVSKKDLPVKEDTPFHPLSPYAVSKITQEALAYQYHKSYGLKTVTTRAFNHTGPRRSKQFVISSFAYQIAAIERGLQKPVIYTGNLNSWRDFSDVRDVVKAYWLATEKCKFGEAYNVGSGKTHQIKDVLKILLSFSMVKIKVKQDPELMRPSDVPILQCDIAKFRKATGWKPKIAFQTTLKDILNYWRKELI